MSTKNYTALLFILLTSISYGQNNFPDFDYWKNRILNDENLNLVQKSIVSDNYIISFTTAELPKQLIDILSTWNDELFTIANPNEDFNSTDEINDSFPNRQLTSIFSNDQNIFINYKHGGIGFHNHIIWCEFEENIIKDIWICNTYNLIDNFSKLKNEIINYKRTIEMKSGRIIKQNYLCF